MSVPLLASLIPMLLLGGGLGFLGGLFGIGGGIIAIPLLTNFYGMDQAQAQGTALAMMVPNLLAAWWRYRRRTQVDLAGAAKLALVGTVTTLGAAQVAQGLDRHVLRLLFAAFLAMLAMGMIRRRVAMDGDLPLRRELIPLAGLAGGASMGLLGIGGGLVVTPILSRWFGLDQRVAQSMGLAMVLPCSVAALVSYARMGNVDWTFGMTLGAGGLISVSAGVALAHAFPETVMRRLFAGVLVGTSLAVSFSP